MPLLKMLIAEITHHWTNFVLTLMAIVAAATLFVAGPTLIKGYADDTENRISQHNEQTVEQLDSINKESEKEFKDLRKKTIRKMRDLGYNLRIVHKDTDLAKLQADFTAVDMPEEYIRQIAKSPEVTKVVHLVARLYQMIDFNDGRALLVGQAPEITQAHLEKKSDMQRYQVKPGTVYLGHALSKGYKVGDSIDIMNAKFEVAGIQPPLGTREDILLAVNLKDAQKLLDKKGKITEIRALGCKCKTIKRIEEIAAQLEKALPEAKVFELTTAAIARDEQRKLIAATTKGMMTNLKSTRKNMLAGLTTHRSNTQQTIALLTNAITPLVLLICAVWVGLLAWTNVRQRRSEIGLLRALGKGSANIAILFLGKALLLGLLGGLLGCLIGFFLAKNLATGSLDVASQNFSAPWQILSLALIGSPVVCMLASYLPTFMAIQQDPAIVLRDD